MPQPLPPLAPMQPLEPRAPLRPMTPLQPQRPRQPMAPLTPVGSRTSSRQIVPTVQYVPHVPYDDGSLLTAPPPPLPPPNVPPPPAYEPPRVIDLGLSKQPTLGGWGGVTLPPPTGPMPLPRRSGSGSNKIGAGVAAVIAVLVVANQFSLFRSASHRDTPEISTPSISVSIPPISVGGSHLPARPGTARPTRQSGRTLDLNGGFDGQRIRVTFTRWVNNATPTNTFLDTPDKGNRLVAAQFVVKNVGSSIYVAAASSAAQVVDTKGRSYRPVFVFDPLRQGKLFDNVVSLTTGHAARGYIAFEVPKQVRIKQVKYSGGSGGSSQTGTWTFTR
jgi:hypothetical protein